MYGDSFRVFVFRSPKVGSVCSDSVPRAPVGGFGVVRGLMVQRVDCRAFASACTVHISRTFYTRTWYLPLTRPRSGSDSKALLEPQSRFGDKLLGM